MQILCNRKANWVKYTEKSRRFAKIIELFSGCINLFQTRFNRLGDYPYALH
jgi:hypothetical protein